MTYEQFEKAYNKIHRGAFVKVHMVSDKGNGYVKDSHMVLRFVQYDHINGVNPSPNFKPNPNVKVLIPNVATYNEKTGNTLISFGTTEVKGKSKYFHNGNEITKEEFNLATKARPSQPTPWITIKLSNIIEMSQGE